jgi:hypothetical protein
MPGAVTVTVWLADPTGCDRILPLIGPADKEPIAAVGAGAASIAPSCVTGAIFAASGTGTSGRCV